MVRLLRFHELPVVPWRNGGGVTREVAASGAPGGNFLWRLSIATVSADGPFSSFVGIDRTIAVLAGRGIALDMPDRTVTLDTESEPFAFTGEAPVSARVIEGETTDLNAMSRRGAFTHAIRQLPSDGHPSIKGTADDTVVVFGGTTVVETMGEAFEAGRFDALVGIEREAHITISPEPGAATYLIEFFRSQAEQKDSKERPETPMS
jgi:environmental stress-induced protein Ves